MARIKIDEKEYDTDDMSQEAINQLTALQFTAQEIKRVQLNLASSTDSAKRLCWCAKKCTRRYSR